MSEQQVREAEEQIVVFELSGESYGVHIGSVQEIIRPPAITAVPRAPEYVQGVINLRGRVIPVVNLHIRFGLRGEAGEATRASRIVVLEIEGHTIGAAVDAVSEVLRIPRSIIEPPGATLDGEQTRHLRGIARLGERLVILLELGHLIHPTEIAAEMAA